MRGIIVLLKFNLQEIRNKINLKTLYLILSNNCNLQCKYCFVVSRKKWNCDLMDFNIAKKGIDFWARKIKNTRLKRNEQYTIIFYGGEPLLNLETLNQSLAYIKISQIKNRLPKNINLLVISNGIFVDKKIAKLFKEYGVSIVIGLDGQSEVNDVYRCDEHGRGIFKRIIRAFRILKKYNVPVFISMSITPEVLRSLKSDIFLNTLKRYNIRGIGLNLLREKSARMIIKSKQEWKKYWEQAPEFSIKFWQLAKKYGIKEYKIENKFQKYQSKNKDQLIDCGGFGGHFAIYPDGKISACSWSSKYFIGDLFFKNTKLKKINFFQKYKHLIPINNKNCAKCEAIDICGGGCPWNKSIIDKNLCLFNKSIFKHFSNNKS